MENSNQPVTSQSMKEARLEELIDSLWTTRSDGNTDVILVCQGKEYPAHRFILEMSSSYFKTMFQSGLKESKSGIVPFSDMEPETLEAILDYLYKGEVEKIKTEEQIKNVLSASHMMNITKLFEYCCFMLGESLSKDNFYDIQEIVSTYENITLKEKILAFVVVYGKENDELSIFQNLSAGQMKTILSFAKIKRLCFDKLLTGLIHWLQYDLRSREKRAKELFACVDGQLVSKSTISSLLVDDKIISEIISQLLKDVALACTLGFDACSKQIGVLRNNFHCKELKIIFFEMKTENQNFFVVQQFDVNTMTWHPPNKVNTNYSFTGASMCYFSGTVHMLGGYLIEKHLLFDIANNKVELRVVPDGPSQLLTKAGLCVFKNKLYVIGGIHCIRNVPQSHAYCTELRPVSNWVQESTLNTPRVSPTVLTSNKYIYVIGGCSPLVSLSVEYFNPKLHSWTTLNCESIPPSVSSQHCLVFNNRLHAVGLSHGQLECWFHNDHKWQNMQCNAQSPDPLGNIVNVCQFSGIGMEVMLLSAGNQCLPTHAWKPLEGKWKELDPITGLCKILNYSSKSFVYCANV